MKQPNSVTTMAAIESLEASIQQVKKVPPFRKLAVAECALESALVVLRELSQRVADLETEFGL